MYIEKLSVALRYPYRIKGVPNVFISYTHGSQWAVNLVESLSKKMVEYRGNIFVDKHNIALGSNWRDTLHKRMGEASHILCFADEISVCKEYVAAELETALKLRFKTNTPRIIIIAHNDLDIAKTPGVLPIFKEIFKRENDYRSPVFILREGAGIPEVFSAAFGEPDMLCSISAQTIQEPAGKIFRMFGIFAKILSYIIGMVFGIICLAQITAISTAVQVDYPLYKLFVPSYDFNGFQVPAGLILLISFFTVFSAVDLWNDLFRIYNTDKFLSKIGVLLRLLVVTFGSLMIIRNSTPISPVLWLGTVTCGFMGLVLSEDVVVYKTQLEKSHRMRAESTDRREIKYVKANVDRQTRIIQFEKNHIELSTQFQNILGASDMLFDSGGKFVNDQDMIRLYFDALKQLNDSENLVIWGIGELIRLLGNICYCMGKYSEAISYYERSLAYIDSNDFTFPVEKQAQILSIQRLIISSHMNNGQQKIAKQKNEKLTVKCKDQIEIAEIWMHNNNPIENSLATQWKEQAQSTLSELSKYQEVLV